MPRLLILTPRLPILMLLFFWTLHRGCATVFGAGLLILTPRLPILMLLFFWTLHHGKYYDKKIKIGIWVWVMGCQLTNKCQFLVLNWILSKRYNFGILVPNLVSQYQKLVSNANICNHIAKDYLFYNDKY